MAVDHLEKARKTFRQLAAGEIDSYSHDYYYKDMAEDLKRAGQPFSAVDPTGKSSDEDIYHAARKGLNLSHLREARQAYTRFIRGRPSSEAAVVKLPEGGFLTAEEAREIGAQYEKDRQPSSSGAEAAIKSIRDSLQKAGADFAALDPTGASTLKDIAAALEHAAREDFLAHARKNYAELVKGVHSADSIDMYVRGVHDNLQKSGEGLSALDPSRQKSDADMQAVLDEAVRRNYLDGARKEFLEFKESTTPYTSSVIEYIGEKIRKCMALAGQPLSALDGTGASSDANVEAELQAAARRIHAVAARKLYEDLCKVEDWGCTPEDVERNAQEIRDRLALAGADASALDEHGKKSATEADEDFKRKIDYAHIEGARKMFKLLGAKDFYSRGELARWQRGICEHFRAAATDARALNEFRSPADPVEWKKKFDDACTAAWEKHYKNHPDEPIQPVAKVKFKRRDAPASSG